MSPTTRRPFTLITLFAVLSLLLAGLPVPQRAVAASGIIGRWNFDEGGGAVATDSAGDNDGAISGGALYTNGTPPSSPSPWALTFDGADDAVTIPNEAQFDLGQLTVAAWVRVDAFNRSWQAIVTKGDGAWRLHRAGSSSFVGFGTNGLSNLDLQGTTAIDDGQWHHVAGTYDGARKAIYVDGALDVAVNVTGVLQQNDYPVMIGGNAEVGDRLFNGAIDDVRIYSRALSAAEIAVVARVGSVVTVTSANTSGPGSLRQAIADAPSGGTIIFAGDYTIPLASSIEITRQVTIDAEGRPITLDGALAGSDSQLGGILRIRPGASLSLKGLRLTHGRAAQGGAIYNEGALVVEGSAFVDNQAGTGGAVRNAGNAMITGATFSGNAGSQAGGALFNGGPSGMAMLILSDSTVIGNTGLNAGGLWNQSTATIRRSSFIDNSAEAVAGAIYNNNSPTEQTWLTVSNSSFSGNEGQVGGALGNDATLTLYHTTVSGNRAGLGGGLHNYANGTLDLRGSIVANSIAGGDCSSAAAAGAVAISATLVEDGGCGATLTGDPRLTPLGDYGGSTRTFALLPGSPAIDAGVTSFCVSPEVMGGDQRGVTRPQGAACDLGAFESRGFYLSITGGDGQETLLNTAFPQPLSVRLLANDSGVNVGAGEVISFTAPISGASITAPSFALTTDASSVVTATVAANGSAGRYTVEARTRGASDPVGFSLINCSAAGVVTSANNSGAGSLREALATTCGGGMITFAADSTIVLTSSLTIERDITIDGSGHSIVLAGSGFSSWEGGLMLIEEDVAVTLRALTLRNGRALTGGAILNVGSLALEGVTLTSNRASAGAGVFSVGTLSITGTSIISNTADDVGGGIFSVGTLSITGTSIISNTSASESGGIFSQGEAHIADSTLRGNTARLGGALIIQESNRVMGPSSITGSYFIKNSTAGGLDGGAIAIGAITLTISDSTFSDNQAGANGGAIANESPLIVRDSTFSGNTSSKTGGAIFSYSTLDVSGSTFSGNAAGMAGGAILSFNTLSMINSTVSGNQAGLQGGGVQAYNTLAITNTTLSANQSPTGGALLLGENGTQSIVNSIIADSVAGGDCVKTTGAVSLTATLVEDGGCGATLTGDPRLTPLGDYGGRTQTFGLLPGSPAIDAGADCPSADQRGVARPQGAGCDLGAFESRGFTLAVVSGDRQQAALNAPFAAPLVVTVAARDPGVAVGSGTPITFTAPPSGASLSAPTFTALTDANGVVTASVSANGIAGSYTVTATAPHAAGTVAFTLRQTNHPYTIFLPILMRSAGAAVTQVDGSLQIQR